MSGPSKSRSKSVIKTKPQIDQIEDTNEETKDEENGSTALLEALVTTPTIIRRYKVPYRNFLRDVKIQMQNENLSNQEMAKIASQRWKAMTYAEKEPYIQEAAYAKEIDAENQKRSARQQQNKRKRKCPKCGGYPASSSPSEQSTNESPTEAATSESEESEASEPTEASEKSAKNQQGDYTTDTSCNSNCTLGSATAEHDAAKSRIKKAAKEALKKVAKKR